MGQQGSPAKIVTAQLIVQLRFSDGSTINLAAPSANISDLPTSDARSGITTHVQHAAQMMSRFVTEADLSALHQSARQQSTDIVRFALPDDGPGAVGSQQ